MSVATTFNVSEKDDFNQQIKTLFNRNTKDKILLGGWIMKSIIAMMQNLRETF